jgi:diguanylate cyclase (GGDEF)-like protein/PAS domain S-box-containing protein
MQEIQMPLTGLIDSAMDAIVSTDEHQRIIIFNGAAELMFGYRADQVIGQHLEMLIPHRHRAHHRKNVDDFGQTGVTTRTMNMPGISYALRADGEEFLFEASISKADVEGRKIYTAILRDITSRRLLESAMRLNQDRLSQAVDIAGVGFFDYNKITEEMYWSPQMRAIFGVGQDEPVSMQTLLDCVIAADKEKLLSAIESVQGASGDGCFALSYRMVRRDGEIRWLAVQMHISFAGSDEERHARRTVGAVRDITRRVMSEEALQLASSVYQSSHEGIVVTDENNLIVDINPAFTELTGYTLDEVKGQNPNIFQSGMHGPAFYQEMWKSIKDTGHWQGEMWDKRRDGELHAKWISISAIHHPDGSLFRYVAQFSDISEKKRRDELIWTQANFDALTSLPNRRLLADRLSQAMSASLRSGIYCGLLSLDLDHFKQLNDTLGHSMGDKLLVEVARRLQDCVREEDTVARMGGDEFLVVLKKLSLDQSEAALMAEQVAEKIRSELCRPYQLGDTVYNSSTSIGIVILRGHEESEENLLSHVDAAMYQAKARGRNSIGFFDADMQAALEKRSQLEGALRFALERGEFTLYYQMQVDHLGHATGAEALLRWNRPEVGMLLPEQFLAVAEETGLILSIGRWVLETACAELARWRHDPLLAELRISINVSARQFRVADFVGQVSEVLSRLGVNPRRLNLELTETLVLDNVEASIAKMNQLKQLGVTFSMDDFGTGYSSLSYLSRLPMDQIKIDESFVSDMTTSTRDAAMVTTIISMAQSLGMAVIAEGVETRAQREFLESRGCRAYQGYFYETPMPVADLEARLKIINNQRSG